MPTFNPQRLDIARQLRGLTKTALADAIGISTRQVRAYEHGERPGIDTLTMMTEKLDMPLAFFFGDDLDEPSPEGTSFRAMSNLTARQRHQARSAATLAQAFVDWIDQRYELPTPSVPKYLGLDPETAAGAIRREWGLGERPIRNTIHAVEARGVRVFALPAECSSVDAFSYWRDDTPYVFLSNTKTAEHRRMDVAHELGHLVLHAKGSAHGREAEQEAAQFASAFLMPAATVVAQAPRAGTLTQIIAAKRVWGVSAAALTYRMHHLPEHQRLLSEWQYRMLYMEMSRAGYLRDEPQGIQAETSRLWAKVLVKLRTNGTPLADVAHELSIRVTDLSKLLRGLVLTTIEGAGLGGPTQGVALRAVQ